MQPVLTKHAYIIYPCFQIYEKLNGKIDELFDLSDYEWDMEEAQGMASRYLVELIEFLTTTFLVFTDLPVIYSSLLLFEHLFC